LIDFNSHFEENPSSGLVNNILSVYSDSDENSSGMLVDEDLKFFQLDIDYPLLEKAKENSVDVSLAPNVDEQSLFENIINYSNTFKSQTEGINKRKEEKLAEKTFKYDLSINRAKDLIEHKFNFYRNKFTGRVMNYNDSLCLIYETNIKEGMIKYIRLYDQFGIKINIDFQEKSNFFEYLSLEYLIENSFILSKEESENIMANYKSDTTNVLRIYYHLIDPFASQDVIINNRNRINQNNNMQNEIDLHIRRAGREKEIIPYRILPKNIDINKYNLELSENKIKEVRTKDNNSLVYFEAILIKEEIDKKLNILISTSSLKVYTSLYNKDIVNILHMHLNDTSEEIALDSVFLEKNEDILKHKNFEVDYRGKKLNYKLLFRDYKLIKIFYNVSSEFIDEPQFEEVRINKDNIVRINSHDNYKDFFARVKNIPLGMIARKDKGNTDLIDKLSSSEIKKSSYCAERHLEELPGFIDLELLFDPNKTLIDEPVQLSLPVCNIAPLHPKDELAFQKSMIKLQMRKRKQSSESLNHIYDEYKNYEEYCINPKLLSQISLEDAKRLMEKLETGINVEEFSSSLEESENVNVSITFYNYFLSLFFRN
jgi:hypothetical protein